jgi:hypothetical protein
MEDYHEPASLPLGKKKRRPPLGKKRSRTASIFM